MNTKQAFRGAAAVGLLLLVLVGPVFADYFDGFDTYPNATPIGNSGPFGPWNLANDNGACWDFTQVTTIPASAPEYPAPSPPNVFEFGFEGACSGAAHNAQLTMPINSTGNLVNFTYYLFKGSGPATPSISYLRVAEQNTGAQQIVLLSAMASAWTVHKFTFNTTPNTQYLLNITMAVDTAEVGTFYVLIDSGHLTGANAIISPANIFFLNNANRSSFNFFPDPHSTLSMNYSGVTVFSCSGSPAGWTLIANNYCQLNDVNIPYAYDPLLAFSTLLTVHVGNSYYRSLIPTSTFHQIVYLDPPSKVSQYIFPVTDISQQLSTGALIYISQGNTVITSGYLDAQTSFTAALVPATYQLRITQGTHSYSTTVNLEAPNSIGPTTVPILITKFQTPANVGFPSTLAYSIAWNCTGHAVRAYYTDTRVQTTGVTVFLYNQTNTGTFPVGSQSSFGSFGSTQFTFNHVFSNLGTYLATFQVTDFSGTHLLGPKYITPTNPSCPNTSVFSFLPALPNFPIAVFGLDQILPNANGYSEIIALIIIVLTAAVFSRVASSVGGVVLSIEVLWFFLALFIPSNFTIIYTFIITSMVGFLLYRRRHTAMGGQ